MLDKTALTLAIIGALNWGSIGLFRFDLVAWIFGGQTSIISRIIYTLVALAGVWCISLLFRDIEPVETIEKQYLKFKTVTKNEKRADFLNQLFFYGEFDY